MKIYVNNTLEIKRKVMFKFDEYPEIKKAHKMSEDFNMRTYKKEFAYERTNNSGAKTKWAESIRDEASFNEQIYANIVFETFSKIKPVLTVVKTGEKVAWNKCYAEAFEKLDKNQRKTLFMLIEDEYPYRLPDEYYDERDWYEESKNLKAVQKK